MMTKREKVATATAAATETFEKLATSIQLNPAYDPMAPVETATYYLYCPDTFVATTVMQLASNELPPENSTKWAPPACSDNAQAYFDGCGWVRCPVFKSLTEDLLKAAQTDVLKRELRTEVSRINADTSDEETDTFQQQFADATLYNRTGEASTFLMVLADERNIPMASLVPVILRKAEAYQTAVAKALARYQNAVDELTRTKPVLTQLLLQERRLHRV